MVKEGAVKRIPSRSFIRRLIRLGAFAGGVAILLSACHISGAGKTTETNDAVFVGLKSGATIVLLKRDFLERAFGGGATDRLYYACHSWTDESKRNTTFQETRSMKHLCLEDVAVLTLPSRSASASYALYDANTKVVYRCAVSAIDHSINLHDRKVLADRADQLLPNGDLEWPIRARAEQP